MNSEAFPNKTMARADLDAPSAQAIVRELNELIATCDRDALPVSAWYGSLAMPRSLQRFQQLNRGFGYEPLAGVPDDDRFPWFLYWEIAWVALMCDFQPGMRVLDMGGASSLFSYFLAARGLDVTTVDLNEALVENANKVASSTGWKLRNEVMDMREMNLGGRFDAITSICVFEHIPLSSRAMISMRAAELLEPDGVFALTFDYANPSAAARIDSPESVREQFVEPSGLVPRGNEVFHDTGDRHLLNPFYHPRAFPRWKLPAILRREFPLGELLKTKRQNDYTFGALFLQS